MAFLKKDHAKNSSDNELCMDGHKKSTKKHRYKWFDDIDNSTVLNSSIF